MEDIVNNITVLSQEDPYLPEYLDFKNLRKEGLEHIGNLSGKIWTDHNVHDPGITILEVLIYALMDLGYRTNLPFKDLIATKQIEETDDNFLTPLDILTVNPTTITDYRKLILEVIGVKNVWLEPTTQKQTLYINPQTNKLSCVLPYGQETNQLHINGLYKVYLEIDKETASRRSSRKVILNVKKILAAHRNICEDFLDDICVLKPLEIGVCAQVTIEKGHSPEKVYGQVIKNIKDFIQPEIHYYTLNELLDKGKTIDDIFAGRPYLQESVGFIDTEELENLERREEIHLSDLYSVVLAIEGVVRVKKIDIRGTTKNREPDVSCWKKGYAIGENQVPVFSLEKTCVDLYSEQGIIVLDKPKIHQAFSLKKKFRLPQNELNAQVPQGSYLDDITTFESVQNDFPIVYGIGEDGLPERASLLRKTQALQLKGYLSFYDQILTNYTSQLANIRSLFSLTPEQDKQASQKHTYFTQLPNTIPGLEKLFRLYESNEKLSKGARIVTQVKRDELWQETRTALIDDPQLQLKIAGYCDDKSNALHVHTYTSAAIRSISINQFVDAFSNEKYTVEILEDKGGYLFVLYPILPTDVLFVSVKRYASKSEALNQATNAAFIGSIKDNYTLVSDLSDAENQHYFNLNYNPVSYVNLIQNLTENKQEYIQRRKQFLDHLLARFGEEFTEYTLLQYQSSLSKTGLSIQTIEDQSSYVNQFAEVSRNRAKAFDYLKPSWNTDNVSGFEKRITLLAGLDNYQRRNLCNFEVSPCFKLQVNDARENTLFRSNRSFESKATLRKEVVKVLRNLRNPKMYNRLEKSMNGFNKNVIQRIFSIKPLKENIVVASNEYHHQLIDFNGKKIVNAKNKKFNSKKTALNKKRTFINSINSGKEKWKSADKCRLIPIDEKNYLNTAALDSKIHTHKSWKWYKYDEATRKKVKSSSLFTEENKVWNQLINQPEAQNYLTVHENVLQWKLIIKGNISLQGIAYHSNKNDAVTAWRQAKVLGSSLENFELKIVEDKQVLVLKNEKGKPIAVSNPIQIDTKAITNLKEDCVQVFSNRTTKPRYKKAQQKFGFTFKHKESSPWLVSYNSYDSEKEALQQMLKAYELGKKKKSYLLSGDVGNPEYRFILRDEFDTFLAIPPKHFETAGYRDSALNEAVLKLKKNIKPVFVKEEPKRYSWSLKESKKEILSSGKDFISKEKAQADFDSNMLAVLKKEKVPFLTQNCYTFKIKEKPSRYRFIYGNTNEQQQLSPIFISSNTFESKADTKKAYIKFSKKLPSLTLKKVSKKEDEYDFALYTENQKQPIAIQYRKDTFKASFDTADEVITFINSIYTKDGKPREEFVENIVEYPQEQFEWRFYKKNAPLAVSCFKSNKKEDVEKVKDKICDAVPPISLNECPPSKKTFCLGKNPEKHHFKISFKDDRGNEFILNSYRGYNSSKEAEAAQKEQWLQLIDAARNDNNYGVKKLISTEEKYADPKATTCEGISTLAVIPEEVWRRFKTKEDGIQEYVTLAKLFPIYPLKEEKGNKCHNKYKYTVSIRTNEDEERENPVNQFESKIECLWESVECFNTIEDTIKAYQHFYTLAGTSNNCRILCKRGTYYIGLVEVMVESACEYASEAEAWDDAFPENSSKNKCKTCIPNGVRSFIYAAEDDNNYITVCDGNYWKFKVVAPSYFKVDHTCYYDSEKERDAEIDNWVNALKEVDWSQYITTIPDIFNNKKINNNDLTHAEINNNPPTFNDAFCHFVETIRECLPKCSNERDSEELLLCLIEKYKDDEQALKILRGLKGKQDQLIQLANYFPVYKTDQGYCYKLYWEAHDKETTSSGLQPCGCEDIVENEEAACKEIYTFISSNCYPCCEEAIIGFKEFRDLFKEKLLTVEPFEKTPHGPYSFRLIDTQKTLGYHPQQYSCVQEVTEAIAITKVCVNNMGMHLLEHLLLRPKEVTEQSPNEIETNCCLLPICPELNCNIEWQPNTGENDPCKRLEDSTVMYIPGSDPYSFWATLVLPAWDKRFRTPENRKAFEQLLYKEVPALVGLNILWLSPRNMCKFEEAYSVWLEWKQSPQEPLCNPNQEVPDCALVACIKELTTEKPCPTNPETAGNCKCGKEEKITYDECCLPPETTGTIFWGFCPPNLVVDNPPTEDGAFITKEKSSTATLVKVKKTPTKKRKPIPKKKAEKKIDKKKLLVVARQRKPKYLATIKTVANKALLKTKSYARTEFFLKNTPTINAFLQLTNFINRYSLQKDNDHSGFLTLIQNATWHLFDKLILDTRKNISKQDVEKLAESLQQLKAKGLSLKTMHKNWKYEAIKPLANTKTLTQLKGILK